MASRSSPGFDASLIAAPEASAVRPVATPPIRAVIFDLDGTLIDTAGEIAIALERTLAELRLPALPKPAVVDLIGRGVQSLVQRALQQAGAAEDLAWEPVVLRFEKHYDEVLGTSAELFPGVREGVERLAAQRMPMAVVTNKLRHFSVQLLERLHLAARFQTVVAGDDGPARKPDGAMLRAACHAMGTRVEETLMLGDSDNDVRAARHAGCPVWCVPYGYNEGRPAASLACDRVVESVAQAARLILAR